MTGSDMYPEKSTDPYAESASPEINTFRDKLTLREVLEEPIVLDSYPWEDNPYSSTPLGWRNIANNKYYFPALRYMRKRIEANTVDKARVENCVMAALEECNHAHAQVCEYSETSMSALLEGSENEYVDETTLEMIMDSRSGSISIAHAGLLVMAYPRLGSLEAARQTVGFHKNGLGPFEEYLDRGLDELAGYIDTAHLPLELQRISPEEQELHYKASHAKAELGVRVEKHPIVSVEKRSIARLTGSLNAADEPLTLELVVKKSTISKEYEHFLGAGMSADILGSAYWRDVRTKKPIALPA